jgi:hypothetical protein
MGDQIRQNMQEDVFTPYRNDQASVPQLSIENVRTYDELETYLRRKYGDIQPLQSLWSSSGNGDSGQGPYRFRLSDGSEISIDGIYSRTTGQIVDPDFDLRTLPELGIN